MNSNRRLDNKFNIFEGMFRNYFFIGVNLVMVGGQVMIIYVGGRAFNVVGLTGEQWGYSILFGFLSIPMGVIIRLIPDELLLSILPKSLFKPSKKGPEVTIEDEEQGFSFPQPLKDVRDELAWLKRMKGGRVNNLRFAMHDPKSVFTRSRSGSRSRSNSIPQTPVEPDQNNSFEAPRTPESRKRGRGGNRSRSNSALGATAVMAGIIAGSVAGWSPIERGHGEEDSLKFSRERGKSDVSSRDGQEGSSQGNNGDDLGPPPPAYGSTLQPPASPERKR
jgi:Ca2+-transporting ATPase